MVLPQPSPNARGVYDRDKLVASVKKTWEFVQDMIEPQEHADIAAELAAFFLNDELRIQEEQERVDEEA